MFGMSLILLILTAAMAVLMAFHFGSEVSKFELKRLAQHSKQYQHQLQFLEIYPGLKILTEILVWMLAVLLTYTALIWCGPLGILLALGLIGLSYLLSRAIRLKEEEIIGRNLVWLIKYFGWAKLFRNGNFGWETPRPHSRAELAHLVAEVDFMPLEERDLIRAAIKFPELKISDIMTPRSKIYFLKDTASLGPKVIDELYATTQKIFPVAHGDLENTLGVVWLEDIAVIAKGDQTLKDAARERPAVLEQSQPVWAALRKMLDEDNKVVFAKTASGKIVGMLELDVVIELLLGSNNRTD